MVARIFRDNITIATQGLTTAEIECAMELMGRILDNLVRENELGPDKGDDCD